MKRFARELIRRIKSSLIGDVAREVEINRMLTARLLLRQLENAGNVKDIRDAEFKVFSQWGEDGIIQYLIRNVPVENSTFVEFGVSNYLESNTRFLLMNDNWSGLIIDGSEDNIAFVRADPIYWQYDLKAVCSFITKENINDLIRGNGFSGDIGLRSVDIDGNDYWVWEAIDVVSPRILILEYNSRFGPDKAVSVPYDAGFVRRQAHHSGIYFGASLKALVDLSRRKGYAFVGCNANGVNAFFVRRDLLAAPLRELTVEEGFVAGKFREARDEGGALMFLDAADEQRMLGGLPQVDLDA